jgi:hypothetical protein
MMKVTEANIMSAPANPYEWPAIVAAYATAAHWPGLRHDFAEIGDLCAVKAAPQDAVCGCFTAL